MTAVWSNRSPIGLDLISQDIRVTPTNPAGLFAKELNTLDGDATIRAGIAHVEASVARCVKIGCQGLYWHGFDWGKRSTQADGSPYLELQPPTPLPMELEYAVNGRSLLEELLDIVHSAGLRSGCLLRPAFPTGDFRSGEFHGMVPAPLSAPYGPTTLIQHMTNQIMWARDLGMSLFYVDNHQGWSGQPWSVDYTSFAYLNDECLLMFESLDRTKPNEDNLFKWGLPWSAIGGYPGRWDNGQNCVWAIDYHETVLGEQTDAQLKSRLRQGLDHRDIVAPMVHYDSRGLRIVREVLDGG